MADTFSTLQKGNKLGARELGWIPSKAPYIDAVDQWHHCERLSRARRVADPCRTFPRKLTQSTAGLAAERDLLARMTLWREQQQQQQQQRPQQQQQQWPSSAEVT